MMTTASLGSHAEGLKRREFCRTLPCAALGALPLVQGWDAWFCGKPLASGEALTA